MGDIQCEGYRRYGGAFTLGPVKWERCKNVAIKQVTITQDGETESFPACEHCIKEACESGMKPHISALSEGLLKEGGSHE